MLHDRFMQVLNACDAGELLEGSIAFTRHLGFDTVTATLVLDQVSGEREWLTVDNTPPGFRATYEDPEMCGCDPVIQHCRFNHSPIIWDQSTYVEAGQGPKWEIQAAHGYRHGIALAMHLSKGRHLFVGVDRDSQLPESVSEVTRMVGEVCLFAFCAQEAAGRVLLPQSTMRANAGLTRRELDCLSWTMEGKTAWEVGRILGISEQTAVRHLNNASHKLDCVNKHHAVAKAMRLGVIG